MAPIPRSPDGVAMKLWRERNVQASPAETTRSRAAVQQDGKPEMQTSRKKKSGPSTAAPPLRSHQRTCNRGRHTPPRAPQRTPVGPPWEAMSAPSTGTYYALPCSPSGPKASKLGRCRSPYHPIPWKPRTLQRTRCRYWIWGIRNPPPSPGKGLRCAAGPGWA